MLRSRTWSGSRSSSRAIASTVLSVTHVEIAIGARIGAAGTFVDSTTAVSYS
jgi:hypothetical protein